MMGRLDGVGVRLSMSFVWKTWCPPLRDHVRTLAQTEAYEPSRRERKKVEMAFAHLKRILKLDRLRLRGLSGSRDEILLAATAQNLRKLAKYGSPSPPGWAANAFA